MLLKPHKLIPLCARHVYPTYRLLAFLGLLLASLDVVCCCGNADGESETARGARRWLARNAAAVRALEAHNWRTTAAACTSLVICLPALKRVHLELKSPMIRDGLGRLLGALAACPRLTSLSLSMGFPERFGRMHPTWMLPSLAPFAQLRSLTKLSLTFDEVKFYPLADVVRALVPLTGLVELYVCFSQPTVVPAALGQLKALRSLTFSWFECVLEAGCLDLPNLQSLVFDGCGIENAEVLASVPALPSLTRIEVLNGSGPPFVAQLLLLPLLQHMVFYTNEPCVADYSDAYLGLPRLPAGSTLLHLELSDLGLAQFPLVLTQLVALEHLNMEGNEFAELPVAITALSRLTNLVLGRIMPKSEPMQLLGQPPLDVRALGDLSAFPVLHKLSFHDCEVTLSASLLGVMRHASLSQLDFCRASYARECASIVQQLSQALERLGRGSVLRWYGWRHCTCTHSCGECATGCGACALPLPCLHV